MRYRAVRPLPLLLGVFIGCLLSACSNSEGVDGDSALGWNSEDSAYDIRTAENPLTNSADFRDSAPPIVEYLPLDDSEYPYAGIPRIVIETENHREIKDRETEIPAKLQIWGETAPESEIMELTIRGRGNTTWNYPKKPYAIKFEKKQAFLGMPNAKKWIFLANYRDRTLIRNVLSLEIARQTDIGWTPQGRFVEVFLNGKYLGNYFMCEKIEIKKERLNTGKESYLLELDNNDDGNPRFYTKYKNYPVNIKSPEAPSQEQMDFIKSYFDSIETALYEKKDSDNLDGLIDLRTFALYWIVHELTTNTEPRVPRSVYMYKEPGKPLKAGPVWDFDWGTFDPKQDSLILAKGLWLDVLQENDQFTSIVKQEWENNKGKFLSLTDFIDSLSVYTKKTNERNYARWSLQIGDALTGDEELDFDSAIEMLKKTFKDRIQMLDVFYDLL